MKKAYININGEEKLFGGIIEPNEYNLIVANKKNRDLREKKLNDLEERITLRGKEYPFEEAVVLKFENGKYITISGHHRIYLCKKYGTEINYTLTSNDNPRICDDTWNSEDRRTSQINEGNKHFIEAKEIAEEYQVGYGTVYTAFKGVVSNAVGRKGNGESFSIEEKERKIGYEILNQFRQINEITHYESEETKKYITKALWDIKINPILCEKFELAFFLRQCKVNGTIVDRYEKIKTIEDAKTFISRVYNTMRKSHPKFEWER